MNIALPAVVIILGLLPGIVFFNSYYSGKFPRALAGISATSELAQWFVFSLPLDLLGVWYASWFKLEPQYPLIGALLMGSNTETTQTAFAGLLASDGVGSAAVYVSYLLVVVVLANVVRRSVWALRLDVRLRFLRMKHEWIYTLSARQAGLPRGTIAYADILADNPDGSTMYQGIVASAEVSEGGSFSQLALKGARRGKGRGKDFEWSEIPGSLFLIDGGCIKSINVRYVFVASQKDKNWHEAAKRRAKALIAAFLFQEP